MWRISISKYFIFPKARIASMIDMHIFYLDHSQHVIINDTDIASKMHNTVSHNLIKTRWYSNHNCSNRLHVACTVELQQRLIAFWCTHQQIAYNSISRARYCVSFLIDGLTCIHPGPLLLLGCNTSWGHETPHIIERAQGNKKKSGWKDIHRRITPSVG